MNVRGIIAATTVATLFLGVCIGGGIIGAKYIAPLIWKEEEKIEPVTGEEVRRIIKEELDKQPKPKSDIKINLDKEELKKIIKEELTTWGKTNIPLVINIKDGESAKNLGDFIRNGLEHTLTTCQQ